MQGFSASNLSSLKFNNKESVNALGAIKTWTVEQVKFEIIKLKIFLKLSEFIYKKLNSLSIPLTAYINNILNKNITSDTFNSLGNLLCSLTSEQISTLISQSVFK